MYTLAAASVIKGLDGLSRGNGIFTVIGKDFKTEAAAKTFATKRGFNTEVNKLGNGEVETLTWQAVEIQHDEVEGKNFVKVGKMDAYYL